MNDKTTYSIRYNKDLEYKVMDTISKQYPNGVWGDDYEDLITSFTRGPIEYLHLYIDLTLNKLLLSSSIKYRHRAHSSFHRWIMSTFQTIKDYPEMSIVHSGNLKPL